MEVQEFINLVKGKYLKAKKPILLYGNPTILEANSTTGGMNPNPYVIPTGAYCPPFSDILVWGDGINGIRIPFIQNHLRQYFPFTDEVLNQFEILATPPPAGSFVGPGLTTNSYYVNKTTGEISYYVHYVQPSENGLVDPVTGKYVVSSVVDKYRQFAPRWKVNRVDAEEINKQISNQYRSVYPETLPKIGEEIQDFLTRSNVGASTLQQFVVGVSYMVKTKKTLYNNNTTDAVGRVTIPFSWLELLTDDIIQPVGVEAVKPVDPIIKILEEQALLNDLETTETVKMLPPKWKVIKEFVPYFPPPVTVILETLPKVGNIIQGKVVSASFMNRTETGILWQIGVIDPANEGNGATYRVVIPLSYLEMIEPERPTTGETYNPELDLDEKKGDPSRTEKDTSWLITDNTDNMTNTTQQQDTSTLIGTTAIPLVDPGIITDSNQNPATLTANTRPRITNTEEKKTNWLLIAGLVIVFGIGLYLITRK